MVDRSGGVERVLQERAPQDVVRDAVRRRLAYEAFLEVAAQAGMVPSVLGSDDQTVSDLFADRSVQVAGAAHRWLSELYAQRIEGGHTLTVPETQSGELGSVFFDFACVWTAMLHDDDLEPFIIEVSAPTRDTPDILLEPFAAPGDFLEAMYGETAEWMARWLGHRDLPRDRQDRMARAFRGFQKFIMLRLELADVLTHDMPDGLRMAFLHHIAGWVDGYGEGQAFVTGLGLTLRALERVVGWALPVARQAPREWSQVVSDVQHHMSAHVTLMNNYRIPREWRRVLGADTEDESGGGGLERPDPMLPLSPLRGLDVVEFQRMVEELAELALEVHPPVVAH